MICPYCDAELENDSKFCTNCGKNLDTPEAIEKMKKTEEPTTPPTESVWEPKEEEKPEIIEESVMEPVDPVVEPTEPIIEPAALKQEEPSTEPATEPEPIKEPEPVKEPEPIKPEPMKPTPSEPVPAQQPAPQDEEKKKKTLIIVIAAAGGALIIFLIVIIIIMGLYISKVTEKVGKTSGYDPTTGDYSGYDFTAEGKIIKTVKDPMNHDIVIQEDSIYILKVNTDYLYDEADAMREKAKLKTEEEVDKLGGTDIQKQATKKAIDALLSYSYSKSELEEYLEDEHYDAATIKYAISNCGADWKEQTAIKVKDSLASGGSSKTSLLSLLVYEGFKEEDVKDALDKNNYDFYEQAVSDACFYKYTYKNYGGAKTRDEAESLLKTNGYTNDEIKFALKTIYDELDY